LRSLQNFSPTRVMQPVLKIAVWVKRFANITVRLPTLHRPTHNSVKQKHKHSLAYLEHMFNV
jgi:hypothetical protein